MSDEKAAEASSLSAARSGAALLQPGLSQHIDASQWGGMMREEGRRGQAVAFHRESQVTDGQKRLETTARR